LDFLCKTGNGLKREENGSYIILLDIRLPKIDGREVLHRIKKDLELKKIPVIVLTTADDTREVDRCYELGCSFYMVKPVDYNQFMNAVENMGAFLSLDGVRVPSIS